jgi:transcriptional regulator with XRE-family HTH domain
VPAVIQKLREWRALNSLSRAQALVVMKDLGMPLGRGTMQSWESGARSPGAFAAQALESFLEKHATISNPPPVYELREKVPDDKIPEIRRLRGSGATLLAIAQRYGISESAVSLICSQRRRK